MPKTSVELKTKMAASVVGSGPSLVPAGLGAPPPPPPAEEVTIPDVDQMIAEKEDLDTLHQLVKMHVENNTLKKQYEKVVDGLTPRIKTIMGTYGIRKALCDDVPLNYFSTERKTVNPVKLLALGVSEDIIAKATDISVSNTLKVG